MRALSYPRRQQYGRITRALQRGLLATVALALALAAAGARLATVALGFALLAAGLAIDSRRSLRLARRSRIGANSEEKVRAELAILEHEGWRIHHSLRWHRGGDIDHLALAPAWTALAFAIETKTRSYTVRDLERSREVAGWLTTNRRGWCGRGALPVLCLAGARRVERWEDGVAVVSLDRLTPVLRRLAGTAPRPGFLR